MVRTPLSESSFFSSVHGKLQIKGMIIDTEADSQVMNLMISTPTPDFYYYASKILRIVGHQFCESNSGMIGWLLA